VRNLAKPFRQLGNPLRQFAVAVGLFAAVGYAPPALGQARSTEVPAPATCGACVIGLRPVVTLNTGDSVIASIPSDVFVARNGTIYVAEFGELPRIFSPDGRFIGELGVRGSGPGEFTGTVGFSRIPGDSLLVQLDDGRAVVVDPGNTPRRQVVLPGVLHPIRVLDWPRRLVATGFLGSPQSAGYQLHILDVTKSPASVISSFGWERGRMRAHSGSELAQHLSVPRGGKIWAADPLEYRLGQWSIAGDSLLQLRRSPTWFTGRSRPWIGNPTTPPPPTVVGFAEDGDGLLWTYIRIPRRNWKEGWPPITRETREVSSSSIDREKLFQILVEVIDPRNGRVVVRQNLLPFVTHVLENGDIVSFSSGSDGSPVLSILRPTLRRP
jgi:hypothetical protein